MLLSRHKIFLLLLAALASFLECGGEVFGKWSRSSMPTSPQFSVYALKAKTDKLKQSKPMPVDGEREQLYEAYNLLHSLAQDFHKPFDAPAVIVVGHQTSGKSALIEALMGFQFNQVGGGTKTRRPIALRMQYNPNCLNPMCFLTMENGKEEPKTLQQIQEYIEAENKRLERDPTRSFDPREIAIRMEYKYCPNMIVIDTPGLIHPPKGRQLTNQQRALQQAAREAEQLVLNKIKCPDYIILCVEDTTDWKHATTRNIVMQADPSLSRTVLVTTKLDTKLPQFSEAKDLQDFLVSPLIPSLFSQLLGGPFFTSVPSGRVGTLFSSNEDFALALQAVERSDRSGILASLGSEQKDALRNVGVSRLRAFLEAHIEESYRRNVVKIIPLLQQETKSTSRQLAFVEKELENLSVEKLHSWAGHYREAFVKELAQVIAGTIRVSPEEFGETLEMESLASASAFLSPELFQSDSYQHVLATEVGNQGHRLFGGAQYHRTVKEFTLAVRHAHNPVVTENEIANAAGVADTHSGVNFMRAACVIAMEKAQLSFEPMLDNLRRRVEHVMKRNFVIVEKLVAQSVWNHAWPVSPSSASASTVSSVFGGLTGGTGTTGRLSGTGGAEPWPRMTHAFRDLLQRIYYQFVDEMLDETVKKCRDDLIGMTKFVTWDVEDKSGTSTLYRLLPTPSKMAEIYNLALDKKHKQLHHQPLHPSSPLGGPALGSAAGVGGSVASGLAGMPAVAVRGKGEEEEGEDGGVRWSTPTSSFSSGHGAAVKAVEQVVEEWNSANGWSVFRRIKPFSKRRMNPSLSSGSNPTASKPLDRGTMSSGTGGGGSTTAMHLAVSPVSGEVMENDDDAELSDYYRVMQLTEEMLSGSSASRTSALVTSLVQYIISSWRNHFAKVTAMKFNCFFLLPFTDRFPAYLRNELDKVYAYGMSEIFDVAETRRALLARRHELLAENDASTKLRERFDAIAAQLSKTYSDDSLSSSAASGLSDASVDEESVEPLATPRFQRGEGPPLNSPGASSSSSTLASRTNPGPGLNKEMEGGDGGNVGEGLKKTPKRGSPRDRSQPSKKVKRRSAAKSSKSTN